MKKLIILAHPSSTSFSHSIAKKYEESATSAGHEVTVLNLYTSELRQEFFEFADIKNLPSDPKRGTLQLLIKKTDTLVFIYPLWWGDMPAILKNFIDRNLIAGFAYRFERHRWIPKIFDLKPIPLLKGKKSQIFFTCDAPKWIIPIVALPHIVTWMISILNFCGIRLQGWKSFAGMRNSTAEQREKWLKYVEKIAKK